MAADFRVFLSAVTSEFGTARDAVASDLQARDLQLRVQRSFRQEPGADTLLRLLHDYIRDCSAVVCVIGTRSGACPSPAAAAEFANLLPAGITEASYTQWEFFFARAHKCRLSLYIAAADYQPDRDMPSGDDFPELQMAFNRHIEAAGLHYTPFSNRGDLRAEVLKEPWPEKPRAKPIVLPYASLGNLFKGREAFLRRLRESLTRLDGGATAIVSKALYGMGGIGKTRAAVEYAWAYREDYTALLFAQADLPEELRRNLAALAEPLLLPEREEAEEEVRLNAVLRWLGANPGWLLILDNIDSPAALAEVDRLMGRLAAGHLVLTSRLDRFARQVEPLEVDVLTPAAAAAFLLEATDSRRRRVRDDDAASYGPDHARVATDLNNLGILLQTTNRLAEAEPLMRRALSIAEASFGLEHPNVANCLGNLAELLRATNRLGEAEPLMRRALAIDDASFGPGHPTVAIRLNNLAGLLCATARLTEAEPLYRSALAIDEVSFGRDHPNVARGLDNLAEFLRATNRLTEAEPLMRRTLAIEEASVGPEHPAVATRLANLAELLRATGRLTEAEPLLRRALAIDEARFVADRPKIATALGNLAALLYGTNRLPEAEPLMRRALAIDEASLGLDHPDVARDLNNLATLLYATNRLSEAEPLMRRHLAILINFERKSGHPHPHRDQAVANYSGLLAAMGNSEAEIEAVIPSLTDEDGPRDPH